MCVRASMCVYSHMFTCLQCVHVHTFVCGHVSLPNVFPLCVTVRGGGAEGGSE